MSAMSRPKVPRKKARMGRPPKPADDVRGDVIRLRVTRAEKRTMENAATKAGKDLSAWLRSLALDAASV
jgi:uncharacterized protein (DUF1778 family)